jgi:methionine sulfoxide reductase heme-binding subunit
MKIHLNRMQLLCHLLCLLPLIILIYDALLHQLTVNPIREISIRTGRTAITILLFSLFCSPLNNQFGLNTFLSIKKPLGLYAAFYALLHFANYIGWDYGFSWGEILGGIQRQPSLIIGLTAFLLLIPLTITSFQIFQKWLRKWWRILHRLVYLIMLLEIIHFFLSIRANFSLPKIFLSLYFLLMIFRIPYFAKWKIALPGIIEFNHFFNKMLF